MPTTFTLNGTAKDLLGNPLAGVLVTLELVADASGGRPGIINGTATLATEASTTTDGSGNYQFLNVVYNDLISPPKSFYAAVIRQTNQRPLATFFSVPSSAGVGPFRSDNVTYQVLVDSPPEYITAVGSTGPQGNPGANGTNGTNGVSFTDKGNWSSATAYILQDCVDRTVAGVATVYVCTAPVGPTATPPESDGAHWRVLLQAGTTVTVIDGGSPWSTYGGAFTFDGGTP